MPRKVDNTYRSRKKNIYGSPYNGKESIYWLFKNIFGWKKRLNPKLKLSAMVPEGTTIINENIKSKYCIAAIGDIMDMHDKDLIISEDLKSFLSDSDYLLGNFEATITDMRSSMTAQRHSERIIDFFGENFRSNDIFLSVANNHAADYSREIFDSSIQKLKDANFNVFGFDKYSYIDLNEDIRVITGSIWSNMKEDYVPNLSDLDIIERKKFNLLYPHWGYELEHYPRNETIESAVNFLEKSQIDAIIGHHSHCPQPIMIEPIERQKLQLNIVVAYSLGDFCTGLKQKLYQFGIVVKIWIGEIPKKNSMGISRIDWKFIRCKPVERNTFEIDFTEEFEFKHQKKK